MPTDLSTNSATTADWLTASENIRISSYDPTLQIAPPQTEEGGSAFTQADFEGALKKASRKIKPSAK